MRKYFKNYILAVVLPLFLFIGLAASAVTLMPVQQGGTGAGTFTSGQVLVGNGLAPVTSTSTSNWDAAYTHISNNGSDHAFIDQSVVIGSSPTFLTPTISGLLWDGVTLATTSDIMNLWNINQLANVDNTGLASGDTFHYDGTNWVSSSTIYFDPISGKIGIGTTVPMYELDVEGAIRSQTSYFDTIRSASGNSISVQPDGDTDNYFSFHSPLDRPTFKVEGGKFIYIDSSNVYDMGISFREDATYSGTLNYEKDAHRLGIIGKGIPFFMKLNTDYDDYLLFQTANNTPEITVASSSGLKINAGGTNSLLLNHDGGNVGIGTSSPYRELSVNGDGVITGNFDVLGNTALGTITSGLWNGTSISDAYVDNNITVDWTGLQNYPTGCTNQFVRTIGDTLTCATVDISADTNLAVAAPITLTGDTIGLDQTGITELGTITIGAWNADTITVGYGGTGLTSATAGYVLIGNSANQLQATSSLFINSNGDIGIGDTTPSYTLDVTGTIRATTAYKISQGNAYYLEDGSNHYVKYSNDNSLDGAFLNGYGGSALGVQGTMKLFVKSSSVGILDSTPDFTLEIADKTTDGYFAISSVAANDGDVFIVDENGYVGIGNTSPSTELDINGETTSNTFNSSLKGGYKIEGNQIIYASSSITSIFVGVDSGNNTFTGDANTGLGQRTLQSLTSGWGNSAFGTDALNSLTTAQTNTAVGREALKNIESGAANVGIGYQALTNNVTGDTNSAIGNRALKDNTSWGNTAVGADALVLATGNKNTAIGRQAGDSLTSGNGNTIIGYNIDFPVSTGSNQLNFGNAIFGTSIDGSGTTVSTGNIGLFDTSPDFKMELAGKDATNGYFAVSSAAANDGDIFVVDESGYIGIGKANPTDLLNVGGDIRIEDDNRLEFGTLSVDRSYLRTSNGMQYANLLAEAHQFIINGAEVFRLHSDGNVGIGTTSPSKELSIDGDIYITGDYTGNVYYGEMYLYQNATSTTISTASTPTKVGDGANVLSGLLNGMTHSNGTTTVTNAGVYKLVVSMSSSGGNSKEYHYTIGVNNTAQNKCHIERKMGTAGDVGAMGISCLLDLSADDDITLMVANVDDTTDLTITDFNLSLEYIGL